MPVISINTNDATVLKGLANVFTRSIRVSLRKMKSEGMTKADFKSIEEAARTIGGMLGEDVAVTVN